MIYFDNAATTFKKPPQVIEAVTQSFSDIGNSGQGGHGAALSAARMIYDILDGKEIDKKVVLPVTLITEENVDQFSLTGWE